MRLQDLIHRMEVIASHQPAVNMLVRNDVFRINQSPVNRFGIFAWTQGTHRASIENNLITYSFSLFYVDRLNDDVSNQIEVQSVGVQVLDNIIRQLDEEGVIVNDAYTFQPFNQRFTDLCAGVYCEVSLSVPASGICAERYESPDYNDDFNEDFLIY